MSEEKYLRRIADAFLLRPQPPQNAVLPRPEYIPPLKEMLEYLVAVPDDTWDRYAFSREILRDKISPEEKVRLADLARACGQQAAQRMRKDYGNIAPSEHARRLGLEVSYPEMPTGTTRVTFAEFMPPNKISIYGHSLEKARTLLRDEGLRPVLGHLSVEQLLLAHEIFHYIEVKEAKTIFTQTEKIDLWTIKPFRNRSTVRCLGEIAGMAFAKELLKLDYSPFVMDVFLVYGYSDEVACRLYEEIVQWNTVGDVSQMPAENKGERSP